MIAASDGRRQTHSGCPLGKHHPVPFPFNGAEGLLVIWWAEGQTEESRHVSVKTSLLLLA